MKQAILNNDLESDDSDDYLAPFGGSHPQKHCRERKMSHG